jgi:hypothetical protein
MDNHILSINNKNAGDPTRVGRNRGYGIPVESRTSLRDVWIDTCLCKLGPQKIL